MLKRSITFEDFDGNSVTEIHYFNLTKTEIVEMEVGGEGGSLEAYLTRIVEMKDKAGLIREAKSIILLSYGEKSDDGKKFVKNDQLREDFKNSAAFDALFIELITSEQKFADFIMGIVPKDLANKLVESTPQDKPIGPPPLPSTSR